MSSWTPSLPLLNADVYLNHLPPIGADNYEIHRNITFVVLGVSRPRARNYAAHLLMCAQLMLWDILIYIEDDIEIIKHSYIRAPILCFVFARYLFS